jgi:hypothetical protein
MSMLFCFGGCILLESYVLNFSVLQVRCEVCCHWQFVMLESYVCLPQLIVCSMICRKA